MFAKPGLDRWKQDQLLRIAYDNPAQDGESYERYADRCLVEHEKPVEEAADFGTRIHDAIEKFFEGYPIDDDLLEYVNPRSVEAGESITIQAGKDSRKHGTRICGNSRHRGKEAEDQKFIVDWKTVRLSQR